MTTNEISYLVFGIFLVLALAFDLGLLSKKNKVITIRKALYQTFFWVFLALAFLLFVWIEKGQILALEYLSAYLMEWSLSIDNIFIFILIFSSFKVREKHIPRALLIGIMMAIIFRVLFITAGVELVERFHWILYLFGGFLIFTGIKMFFADDDDNYDPHKSKIYKMISKVLPVVNHDGGGKFIIQENGKRHYTILTAVVLMLAFIDLVFALDSIPAVMGISRDRFVIYTSNVFAVLGLRSLFFLLRGAVAQFDYLQHGIAIVLVFIGIKMLAEHWIDQWLEKSTQSFLSLLVICVCIAGSIFYSIFVSRREEIEEE